MQKSSPTQASQAGIGREYGIFTKRPLVSFFFERAKVPNYRSQRIASGG